MVEPLSIVTISGLGIWAIYQLVLWIRNGGQSQCSLGGGQTPDQPPVHEQHHQEMLRKIDSVIVNLDALRGEVSSIKLDVDKLKAYTLEEDQSIQNKVDTIEKRVRDLSRSIIHSTDEEE